jgi:hypothetical protein
MPERLVAVGRLLHTKQPMTCGRMPARTVAPWRPSWRKNAGPARGVRHRAGDGHPPSLSVAPKQQRRTMPWIDDRSARSREIDPPCAWSPPPSRGPRPSLSREPPSKKAHAANALRIILPAESISSFRKGPFNLGATAVMAASATPATSERRRRGLSTYPYENSADAMTPQEFIGKWRPVALTERQAAQEHFIDLCRLFRHPTPVEADPSGEWYCFEKGAMKSTGNPGWADVWKRGFFAFEYKKRKKNLKEAQDQLAPLRLAPREPADPLLLIVLHRARYIDGEDQCEINLCLQLCAARLRQK